MPATPSEKGRRAGMRVEGAKPPEGMYAGGAAAHGRAGQGGKFRNMNTL